jgi:predicted nucleotidyltransferase
MMDERFGINLEAVRSFLAGKDQARSRILDERFARAAVDFKRIVEMIVERFNPLRVYQWGSLLDRTKFSEISDIDIAVEGLSGFEEFSSLFGEAQTLSDFPLDIVEMEKIGEDNARYIREYGRIVYERPA